MGAPLREWFWREVRRKYYVKHRVFEARGPKDVHEVAYSSHLEDSRPITGINGKMFDEERSRTYSVHDIDGMTEIWHVGGEHELPYGVPFPLATHEAEWSKENDAARQLDYTFRGKTLKGVPISLRQFWTMLGDHHVMGWFGRGRFKLLLILLAVAIGGVVAASVAGEYFASQARIVCYTIGNVGGNQTIIACPTATASVTSSVTSSVHTVTVK